tara:strand:- start:2019 stop:3791 length:1773 start_codon:yes stop_codon:yes gene_type:complete
MSVIETLTEGIRQRSLAQEGEALLGKWEQTGLLEGLNDTNRTNMARLLENQAAQLLKESTTMQAGDVEGFASVAFPIVRRVFGGLLAQDLVSVQPMSLPSGLIFFMDFVYSPDSGMGGIDGSGSTHRLGATGDQSIYGQGRVGRQILSGASLADADGEKSFYNLGNGFSSPTGSITGITIISSGTFGGNESADDVKTLRRDPDLVSGTSTYVIGEITVANSDGVNLDNLSALVVSGVNGAGDLAADPSVGTGYHARRLNQFSGSSNDKILLVGVSRTGGQSAVALSHSFAGDNTTAGGASVVGKVFFPKTDNFVAAGDPFGALKGSSANNGWGLETSQQIPEIDIKVDSIAVTAITKKLKAKWSPELAQDLNAYHNLDAEVELTSILSEQIALEIDQEILSDLVAGASGGTIFWSRRPGKFLNRDTGADITNSLAPTFTGTVSEWYETLLETINDLSARIHRKTLRGGANFIVCSPEIASLLEFTAGFKASVTPDEDQGSWGAMAVGSLSRKMDIYVDPYFIRNVVLVGRKGTSFLESGYVYAPYVPLQVTPTIFGTEDFVPRKGVMTRYAKKMVRPDMYGLVVCYDLAG